MFWESEWHIYHDTQIHYLMERDPLLLKDQADGMDIATAN